MSGLTDHEAVDLLTDMLRIYSPSRKEAALAAYLADRMRELGFQRVVVDDVDNVVGVVGSGHPSILLCGHMDTVPGVLPVRRSGDLLYGRGAVDAKAALAAMIVAASRLSGQAGLGQVLVAAVADEEGNGLGIKELLKRGLNVQYAIFGEPSGVDRITVGYKGRVCVRLRLLTASVHASAPWMADNAVLRMMEVWREIKAVEAEHRVEGDRYGSLSACLTRLCGGEAHNVTPSSCEMVVDFRVPPGLGCSRLLARLNRLVEELGRRMDFPKLEMEVLDSTEPYEADRSSLVVRALIRSIIQVLGRRPLLLKKTGTGDMNTLGSVLKIPTVTYGPGNPHLSHTEREAVEISDYLKSIRIYEAAVRNLALLARNG